ncbi:SprT-like domain-containing protein Spartan [Phytophthora citrophthora]|uniref:SprT-like domain-containing protein Spartan n=1 Tax=Phytophthora citrophthora TaxID=4793 RepID=A0AAD9LA15_9STRA|nr:SprT-like domain-containing protein Spartan [Phytophthora citrophthora]
MLFLTKAAARMYTKGALKVIMPRTKKLTCLINGCSSYWVFPMAPDDPLAVLKRQKELDAKAASIMLANAVATARGDALATQRCDLLALENEYLDPNPDLHSLFLEYNRMFFEGRLAGCEVKWSKRMTLCEPLLKLRPRSDMVNTLLVMIHEMIHAYVFVATPVRDHEDHGPLFQAHMNRINDAAKTKITVFHTFHDEVDAYRQHVWQCSGSCRRTAPYFGLVKRAMNRPPGPTDRWWADHQRSCGGSYTKIEEPAEFTAKQAKKKERERAREEKKRKKSQEEEAAPSVKQFFPRIKNDGTSNSGKAKQSTRGETKPLSTGKKAILKVETGDDSNKKHKKEHEAGRTSSETGWGYPSAPVIFSEDGEEDGYFLVGDVQALFQTPLSQSFAPSGRKRDRRPGEIQEVAAGSNTTRSSAVVDLTVSDTGASEDEQLEYAIRLSLATQLQATATERPRTAKTGDEDVIKIE